MNDKKIIMAGLANNKTSLGEVFRLYMEPLIPNVPINEDYDILNNLFS